MPSIAIAKKSQFVVYNDDIKNKRKFSKKVIFIVGVVICLLAINGAAAKNTDNITSDADVSFDNFQLVDDEPILSQNQLIKTQIEVESTTNFDVVGDYFKVKLLDVNNQPLANSQLTFNVDGKNY